MSGLNGHILLLVAAVFTLGLVSCARDGRVIPKKDMIALYEEMFIADQWLKEHPEARAVADTTLFFDPIFRAHGYCFKDYEKSIEYYSGKTEELREVMDSVSKRLKKRSEYYQRLSEKIREANAENARLRVDYRFVNFSSDSFAWAADGILWPPRDSLPEVSDSLGRDADTLTPDGLPDGGGLTAAPDSLRPVGKDSLLLDSRMRHERRISAPDVKSPKTFSDITK